MWTDIYMAQLFYGGGEIRMRGGGTGSTCEGISFYGMEAIFHRKSFGITIIWRCKESVTISNKAVPR